MKNVFNPIYNLLLNMAAYASLGTLLFLEFGEPFFFAAGLAVSVFLFFLHGLYLKKTPDVTKAQHFVFMLAAIVLLFALLLYDALTVKRSDHFLLILTLASLSPLYNFCGYVRFTRIDENTSLLKYALGILMVPFTAFLIYNHYTGSNYKTIYMIVIVAAYYFVLFSLIKIIALVIKEKNLAAAVFSQPNANRLMTVFLALVLPLTGLILNQYLYNGSSAYAKQMGYEFLTAEGGFAGDFSHPVFYALTLLNGCCLLIPLLKYEKVKLLVFYCKAFGYPFILYMAVAFLPVLPVGVMALCFLVGFYAFVPLALAVWQGKKLLADYRFLKNAYQKNYARAVLILAVLTLPFLLTAGFIYDKINYEKALVYAEQYHTEATETIDIPALERTLAAQYAGSYQRRLFNTTIHSYYSYGNIPLISKAYELTVFGGQELSRDCRRTLQALFLDAGWYNGIADQTESLQGLDHYTAHNAPVTVSDVRHTTRYDETIDAYRTWVDLDLKNSSAHNNEFQTVFDLPDGVYVSDYSLYVGKEKKMGLLTDRRAALSIYSSIVRSQLDPGILHYIDDDSLELRVFPFLPNETRQTGFELIHKNNFALNIGGVGLTVSPAQGFTAVELPNAVLLSGEAIEKLPPLNRALDYYFILDCSADSDVETLSDRISSYAAINDISEATVYAATYRFDKYALSDLRKTKFQQEGGFNLHLAMQDIMKNADPEKTPVILFATDEDESMVYIPKRMKNHAYPELEFYYRLTESPYAANLILTPYSLITNYKFDTVTRPTVKQARAYQGKAVISDGRDRLVILNETPAEQTNNPYLDAMALAVEGKINLKNGVKNPLGYIKRSFLSHVLTPATAFIVVETKQQEEDLLALQEKILKADAEQENGPSLAEPSLGALLLTVCLYLLISKKRKRCVLYEKNANCITTACLKTPFCEIARFIQSFKTRPVDTEPALGDQPTDSHRERRGRLRGLFKRL